MFKELDKRPVNEVESEILNEWKKKNIFEKTILNREGKEDFVFYDGPIYANAKPGDILNWGHGGVVTHSALYVGNGTMVHATNPSQGVIASNVSSWDRGSYDSLMGVIRVN